MSPGDFLLCTFEGDTNLPPTLYAAEIRFVDLVGRTADCYVIDSAQMLTVDYSPGEAAAWAATDQAGAAYVLQEHDIYVPQDASPTQDDVALLTFSDGSKTLGFVESITQSVNVQLYQQPYYRLSIELDAIVASEWDAHPPGEFLASVQRCYRDNTVPPEELLGVFSDGWWSLATRRDADPGRSVRQSIRSQSLCTRLTNRRRRGKR